MEGHDMHSGHGGHDMHSGHGGHDMHSGHGGHDVATQHSVVAAVADLAKEHLHMESRSGDAEQHSGHGSMAGHMMSMTFHGGYNETVLFEWWKFNSIGGLMGSISIIFIMAVLYEGLKYYREYLFWRTYNSLQYRAVQPPEEKPEVAEQARVVQPSMCSKTHAWQTVLHAVQVSVSYLLMLVFMTYNTWLCVAVVAGAAFGNFLFGWKKSVIVDVTEHCH